MSVRAAAINYFNYHNSVGTFNICQILWANIYKYMHTQVFLLCLIKYMATTASGYLTF